jgi:methionyl-tRNA formyltransferase
MCTHLFYHSTSNPTDPVSWKLKIIHRLRGAAPLQHTILQGNKYTGVTLQTLDPHAFDHGDIISQVPIRIPRPDKVTYQELLELVTPEAAKLLTDGIRDRLFLNPPKTSEPKTWPPPIHAHKILPEHKYIDPRRRMTMYINRQYRALGRLWSFVWTGSEKRRVIFNHIEFYQFSEKSLKRAKLSADMNTIPFLPSKAPNGPELWYTPYLEDKGGIIIRTTERTKGLRFKDITVEGQQSKPAVDVLSSIGYERGGLRCIVWALPERKPEKSQEE